MTMALTKRGGIWFWRLGRFGGSFYMAGRPSVDREYERVVRRIKRENARRLNRWAVKEALFQRRLADVIEWHEAA
jgi:hypothetical protein